MKSNLSSAIIQCGQALSAAAVSLTDRGRIDEAADLLADYWQGYEADVESENPDVLLACGLVMSVGGLARQVSGAQERAKNLYTKAVRLSSGYLSELATVGLAFAYWRSGERDNGLSTIQSILNSELPEIRFRAWLCKSVMESESDLEASQQSLEAVAPMLDDVSVALRGKFHGQRAYNLEEMAGSDPAAGYLRDRAIIEYEAASFAFEDAGNISREATVTNNLAGLYLATGQYARAHANVDRAISLFTRMEDKGQLALSYDQKAKIYLAETRYADAEKMAERSVRILKGGDHSSWLDDSVKTLEKAKAANRLRETTERETEKEIIRRALEVTGGATSKAAQLLGLTQPGLAFKIEKQYPELLGLRKVPRVISHRPTKHSRKK